MTEYPDLHHKMSKKIAQLTKVIYHLNTRNDDHEAEVAALSAQHQAEVDDILRDAASKLNKFKEMAQKQREGGGASDALVKALTDRHERDRLVATAELESIRKQYAAKEKDLESEYAEKLSSVKGDVRRLQDQLSARMDALKDALASVEAYKASSVKAEQLEKLKRQHQEEMADLVRQHNKKYSDMLAQRMNEEDTLKIELEKLHQSLIDAIKQEHKTAIQRLTSQCDAERLARQEVTADRDLLERKFEALTKELQTLKAVQTSSQSQLEQKCSQLQSELEATRSELDSNRINFRTKTDKLTGQLAEAEALVKQLKSDAEDLRRDNEKKSSKIMELRGEFDSTMSRLRDLEASLFAEREALSKMRASGDATTSVLSEQLSAARAETAKALATIVALERKCGDFDGKLNETLAATGRERTEAAETLNRLTSEKAAIQSKLDESLAELMKAYKQLEDERSRGQDVDSSKAARIRELESAKSILEGELASTHTAVSGLREELSATKVQCQDDIRKATEKHEAALQSALEAASSQLAETTAELHRKHSEAMKLLRMEHESEVSSWKSKFERATADFERASKELKDVSSSSGADIQAARAEISRLAARAATLEQDLTTAKQDADQSARLIEALKKQVEELRKEMKDIAREAAAKLERELTNLELNNARKLASALDEQKLKLLGDQEDAVVMLKQQYESRLSAATQAHAEAISRLEDQVTQLQEQLKLCSSEATMSQANHQKALEDMRAANEREMKSLSVLMADKLQAAEDAGRQEVERQRKAFEAQKQQELKDTQARHESVVSSLKSQHESTLKQLHDDFASASALARHEAEVNKATALKQQTEKLTNDHESMVGVLNSRHKDEVDRWERKLEEVKLALKSALDRGDGLAEQLTRTKEQFASAIEQAAADLRLTIARHESLVANLEEDHKRTVNGLLEEHMSQLQAFQSEFQSARELFDEQKSLMEARIAELELKYKNRESRPEDVARIKKLAELCQEKDAQIKKTQEELKFFKLELLNREENFNKMFNRQPTVGVMQVVKPKAAGPTAPTPTAASGSQSATATARKTTLPSTGSSASVAETALPPLGPSSVSNTVSPAATPARVGSGGLKK